MRCNFWWIIKMLEKLVSLGRKRPKKYRLKYDTIGHEVLDLETRFGATNSDYDTLDDLIDEAK